MNAEEGEFPHIWLDEGGANEVFVRKNEYNDLEINGLTFGKPEIAQLRNFIIENWGNP